LFHSLSDVKALTSQTCSVLGGNTDMCFDDAFLSKEMFICYLDYTFVCGNCNKPVHTHTNTCALECI
jgi:hypothetical protein